jgi:hypothetical protein
MGKQGNSCAKAALNYSLFLPSSFSCSLTSSSIIITLFSQFLALLLSLSLPVHSFIFRHFLFLWTSFHFFHFSFYFFFLPFFHKVTFFVFRFYSFPSLLLFTFLYSFIFPFLFSLPFFHVFFIFQSFHLSPLHFWLLFYLPFSLHLLSSLFLLSYS